MSRASALPQLINRKLDGALTLREAWGTRPVFLGAFNQSFQEDSSGQAPDDRIPGGIRFPEELRGCQCDDCCTKEAQRVGRLLASAGKAGDKGVPTLMSLASFTSPIPEECESPCNAP